ncbi:MAG: DUF4238 domain-containing protein [Candidatus Gracilibacteria bacterium]|nr:DUF4238 domain-containing protein [Candidatus Gracilibacteria bacterium]
MNKQITINQHFVPQCYLKEFTTKMDGKTFVYNKKGGLLKNKYIPKSIGFKELLYEFNLKRPDNKIENFFSKLESEYSMLSKKLLSLSEPDNFNLSNEEQITLLLFVLRLSLGNPSQYDKNRNEDFDNMWKRELELHDLTENEKKESLKKLDEYNRISLPTIIKVGFNEIFINQILARKKFIFYLSNGKDLFLTSDNPVLEWYTNGTGLFPGTATFSDTSYGVALSPFIHLQIIDNTDYEDIPSLAICSDIKGEKAKKHNKNMFNQCDKFVYGINPII